MQIQQDEHYMRLALQLAELGRGQTAPNPMVGAVIVQNGEIIGQGAHLKAGGPHAEVHALRMAGEKAKGATLYVTLEPCSHHGRTPPCADAVIQAGIRRIVVAIEDSNPVVTGRGIERLRSAGIEVVTGILSDDAYRLNEMFFTWATRRRPFVVWKCASTLDGYIATKTGDSKWVTGDGARNTVQQLRKDLPAIAVGIGTVLADDPRLTVRDSQIKQPLRVIFDSRLRFPDSAAMLREPGSTLIYTVAEPEAVRRSNLHHFTDHAPRTELEDVTTRRLEIVTVPGDSTGKISLKEALADLAERNVTGMLLEGGSALVAEFMRQQLIDKIVFYVAPKLLGGGIHALSGMDFDLMRDAVVLKNFSWSQVGTDLRLEAYPDWSEKGCLPDSLRKLPQ